MSLFFACFRVHVSLFLLWHGDALVIFQLNILCRQRHLVQQWQYEFHMNEKNQVTQDFSKIETLSQ